MPPVSEHRSQVSPHPCNIRSLDPCSVVNTRIRSFDFPLQDHHHSGDFIGTIDLLGADRTRSINRTQIRTHRRRPMHQLASNQHSCTPSVSGNLPPSPLIKNARSTDHRQLRLPSDVQLSTSRPAPSRLPPATAPIATHQLCIGIVAEEPSAMTSSKSTTASAQTPTMPDASLVADALVFALAVKPKKPTFDLNQVAVQYLLVTPTATTSTAYLSLNITLLFTAGNPNKVGIRYAPTRFYVLYHGVPLGTAVVEGFEQAAHSAKMVAATVEVSRFDVMQTDALELVRDAEVNDRVELRITGDVGAKIRFLGVTSPRVKVSIYCAIVISPRRQALTYKQCGVDGLNV